MSDLRRELLDLATRAKDLHIKERLISLESVLLVGELERRNAAVNIGMTSEQFAAFVALTPNQYWKRAQAARVMRFFPGAVEMVRAGETQVSHLALISPKITQANAAVLLDGIRNKSKREVEALLSRVTADGLLLDKEAEVELRIKLTLSQVALLDRAREVLSHGGQVPGITEVLVKALGDLLEKRDPVRKAERAVGRRMGLRAPSPGKEPKVGMPGGDVAPSPGKDGGSNRPGIPTAVRHAVWLRDEGRCTWTEPDGARCGERSMLELDHIEMWCRGGEHKVDNLTLRCRRHNLASARRQLGGAFMAQWETPRRMAVVELKAQTPGESAGRRGRRP